MKILHRIAQNIKDKRAAKAELMAKLEALENPLLIHQMYRTHLINKATPKG